MKGKLVSALVSLGITFALVIYGGNTLKLLAVVPALSALVSITLVFRGLLHKYTGTAFTKNIDGSLSYTSMLLNVRFRWDDVEKISLSREHLTARIILKDGAVVQSGKQLEKTKTISHNDWFVINLGAIDLGLNGQQFIDLFRDAKDILYFED